MSQLQRILFLSLFFTVGALFRSGVVATTEGLDPELGFLLLLHNVLLELVELSRDLPDDLRVQFQLLHLHLLDADLLEARDLLGLRLESDEEVLYLGGLRAE